MPEILDHDGLRRELATAIREAGGVNAFARSAGISPGYVSEVLNGKRPAGASIAEALGLQRLVAFRRKAA